MTDYIEREAAIEAIRKAVVYEAIADLVERAINSIPAADVRPVVLCRDCVNFDQFRPHDGFCMKDGILGNHDEFFCADGKKREGAE